MKTISLFDITNPTVKIISVTTTASFQPKEMPIVTQMPYGNVCAYCMLIYAHAVHNGHRAYNIKTAALWDVIAHNTLTAPPIVNTKRSANIFRMLVKIICPACWRCIWTCVSRAMGRRIEGRSVWGELDAAVCCGLTRAVIYVLGVHKYRSRTSESILARNFVASRHLSWMSGPVQVFI